MAMTQQRRTRTAHTEDFDQAVETIIRDPETEELLEDTDALLEEIDAALEEAEADQFKRNLKAWAERQPTPRVEEVGGFFILDIPCGCV